MTSLERKLELTKEVASWYRSKALYFNCLAKRRFRPQFDCCKTCNLKTEEGEFCNLVFYEIDAMSDYCSECLEKWKESLDEDEKALQ